MVDIMKKNGKSGKNQIEPKPRFDTQVAKQTRAIQLLATGATQEATAKDIGISKCSMHAFYHQPATQALIAREAARYIQALPDVVQDVIDTIQASANMPIDVNHKQFDNIMRAKTLAQRHGENMLKAVGMIPTHQSRQQEAPVQYINIQEIQAVIYNDMMGNDSDGKAIDITPERGDDDDDAS